MTFAADKNAAEFGGIRLYIDEYSFERAADTNAVTLLDGSTALRFGGGGVLKIKLTGTSEGSCAARLDGLLSGGEGLTLSYAGITFSDVIVTKYSCLGKSGVSERVSAEFSGVSSAAQTSESLGEGN